jgi:hypothetical protein
MARLNVILLIGSASASFIEAFIYRERFLWVCGVVLLTGAMIIAALKQK